MTEVKEYFEVQHHTLIDGWVNCWTDIDMDDNETPAHFASYKEALSELDDLFDEVEADFVMGFRDDKYSDSEYRIVRVVSGVVTDIEPYTYILRGSE